MKNESPIPREALGSLLWTIHLLSRVAGTDKMRFLTKPGMAFAAREVESVKKLPPDDLCDYELRVNIGGMDGTSGPLPPWMNEILAQEDPDDAPLGDFLNIFSHRFVTLLYQAWEKHRPPLRYMRTGKDEVSRLLFCLLGVQGLVEADEAIGFRPARLCSYVGAIGHSPRSAAGLQGMLRDYFAGTPLRVKQFVLQKVAIAEDSLSRLGKQGAVLGKDLVLGERVKDVSTCFRVHAGPVDRETFEGFLPGGREYRHLMKLMKIYVPSHLTWDAGLLIKGEAIPKLGIGQTDPRPRLGYNLWLTTRPRGDDEITFKPV